MNRNSDHLVKVLVKIDYDVNELSLWEIMDDLTDIKCGGTRHGIVVSAELVDERGRTIQFWKKP